MTTKAPKKNNVPAGDARLSVNLHEDLHLLLRMEALKRKTSAGEILEYLIKANLPLKKWPPTRDAQQKGA